MLTAADGRSVEVEILGFEGKDKVRFKRADTGQIFTTPITVFSEADQEALNKEAAEAAKKPPALREGDLQLELSRVKLDSRKSAEPVSFTDGTVEKEGLVTITESWGYGVTLRNASLKSINDLRVDYMLFVKVEAAKGAGSDLAMRREIGSVRFESIPPGERVTVRTRGITTQEVKLKGRVKAALNPPDETRDTLYGIWLRVYRGDELVLEQANPTTLIQRERWTTAEK